MANDEKEAVMLSGADQKSVDDFKVKTKGFWSTYKNLYAKKDELKKYPALQPQYNNLLTGGLGIREKITYVTNKIDAVAGWFKNIFGMDGLTGDNLGVIQLIPLAVIGGSTALISKWVKDVIIFNKKLAETRRLEATGVPPEKAAQMVMGLFNEQPMFGGLKYLIIPALVIGAIVLIPKLKKGD